MFYHNLSFLNAATGRDMQEQVLLNEVNAKQRTEELHTSSLKVLVRKYMSNRKTGITWARLRKTESKQEDLEKQQLKNHQ